jgi:hypothetical protein
VYAIRRVKTNEEGFKLNGTRPLLVYGDDVDVLVRIIHMIKKLQSSLDTNAVKTMYIVMS